VTVSCREVHAVDLLELLDRGQSCPVEGKLLLEGMQNDALEQISEGNVEVLGEALQDLQQPPLHPDTRLDPLYRYHSTTVPYAAGGFVPGAQGMEIGGDWYSVISLDDERFTFVVGDVSGRGLNAATVMAALRFTIRACALEGFSPTAILERCSGQLHVLTDGHFAPALVGVGNAKSRRITLANAGHFNKLLIDGQKTAFLETVVGVPLGVSSGGHKSVTVAVPPESTLTAFTDGLLEHRGESPDVGLKRLAEVTRQPEGPLDRLITKVVSELTDDASEDDIAILGMDELVDERDAKAGLEEVADALGSVVLKITGELDISNVGSIQAAIQANFSRGLDLIVFDLSELQFMDSSGLAMLLALAEMIDTVELRNLHLWSGGSSS